MRLRELFADKTRDPQTHERYYEYEHHGYVVGVQVLERISNVHPDVEVSIKAATGGVAVIEKRSATFQSRADVAKWIGEQLDEIDDMLAERYADDVVFDSMLSDTIQPDASDRSERPSDQAAGDDDDTGDTDE